MKNEKPVRAGRRLALGVLVSAVGATLLLAGCSGESGGSGGAKREVVLYSSVDRYVLDEAIAAIEADSDLDILLVTDTEATKTFGLVERLTDERERPAADVWWSSEPFGTITLSQRGVLAERAPEIAPEGWPRTAIDPNGVFVSLGARARVIAYDPERTPEPPTSLAELTDPKWRGKVAIANPHFGTTRGHVAALVALWGEEAFEHWLTAMRDNGMQVFDSNSTVVRELALGTVELALTDSDDVWASAASGRSVSFVAVGSQLEVLPAGIPPDHRSGPIVFPNTVAIVAGAPHPDAAADLARRIVSADTERLLANSDSRNIPLQPETAAEFPQLRIDHPVRLDLNEASAHEARAIEIVERVLGD